LRRPLICSLFIGSAACLSGVVTCLLAYRGANRLEAGGATLIEC
jgi:hypothetical protein